MPLITKTVKGRKYTYIKYYENGIAVEKYCGPEGSIQAKRKALGFEIELREKRAEEEKESIRKLKKEFGRLPRK